MKSTGMTRTDQIDDDTAFTYDHGIPLHPVHPGRTIAAERSITADTALSLSRLLGPSAQFWMTLQTQYDLATTEQERGQAIREEVSVLA